MVQCFSERDLALDKANCNGGVVDLPLPLTIILSVINEYQHLLRKIRFENCLTLWRIRSSFIRFHAGTINKGFLFQIFSC
jgi:hypothetical protein